MSMSGDVAYVDLPPEEARAVAASELRGGLAWTVFGIAVLALSLRMDRLESAEHQPVHRARPAARPARHRHDPARRAAGAAQLAARRPLRRRAAAGDERRRAAAPRPRRRPDRRVHRRPARPRAAVLGRRDDLRDGVDHPAAGAAASCRRARADAARGRGRARDRPRRRAGSSPGCSRTRSWSACPERERREIPSMLSGLADLGHAWLGLHEPDVDRATASAARCSASSSASCRGCRRRSSSRC